MSQETFSILINFIKNGGRLYAFSQESGMRKTISQAVSELGLSSILLLKPEELNIEKLRKSLWESFDPHSEMVAIFDFTSSSSPIYYPLLDEFHEMYGDRLKVIALVDKSYQGLVSLLFSKGAKAVFVKPLFPNELKSRIMSLFAQPSDVDKIVAFGRSKLAQNLVQEAVSVADKIMTDCSLTHQTLLFCGDAYLEAGRLRQAGRCYIQAFKDEQLSFQAFASLAKLCQNANKPRGELFWLKKFFEINSLDYKILLRMGESCLILGKNAEAKAYFERSIQIARKLLPKDQLSEHMFGIASLCAGRNVLDLAREFSTLSLRDGNVGKDLLIKIAYFRMKRLEDLDGAGDIFRLLAVREEKRFDSMDKDFWSTALYNAAMCYHAVHKDEKILHKKYVIKRACDFILVILLELPEFGLNDPKINANILTIASNPLQPNNELEKILRGQGRL